MGAMASQITSLAIVYSTVYSGADQRKDQSSVSLAFLVGNSPVTGEFPSQMASNPENVSIWWRHHAIFPHDAVHQTITQIGHVFSQNFFNVVATWAREEELVKQPGAPDIPNLTHFSAS